MSDGPAGAAPIEPRVAVHMQDTPAEPVLDRPSTRKPYHPPVLVELGAFERLTRDFFPQGMGDLTNFFTGEEPLHDETS